MSINDLKNKAAGALKQFEFPEPGFEVPGGPGFGATTSFTFAELDDTAKSMRDRDAPKLDPDVPVFLLQFAAVPKPERLIVTRIAFESGMSADYRCEVDFTVFEGENQQDKLPFELDKVLYAPAVLSIHRYQDEQTGDQAVRVIHGIVTEFAHRPGMDVQQDEPSRYRRYQVVIGSPLAHEAWRVPIDCKIYQDQTVPQVLMKLLEQFACKRGNVNWELDARLDESTYQRFDYLVRWLETPYDFFRRLCGEAGIVHNFIHLPDRLILRLADANPQASEAVALSREFSRDQDATWTVRYDDRKPEEHGHMSGFELVTLGQAVPLVEVRDVIPDRGELSNDNVDAIGKPLGLQSFLHAGRGQGVLPDAAAQKAQTTLMAKLEAERIACRQEIYSSKRGKRVRKGTESTQGGLCGVSVTPGDILRFEIEDDTQQRVSHLDDWGALAKDYLVTAITLAGSAPDPESEGDASGDQAKGSDGQSTKGEGSADDASAAPRFWLDCEMIDLRRTLRPTRWKPQPEIGPQWAKITATQPKARWYEDGNTARVRVVFPWYANKEELSCWVHHLEPSQYFQTPLIEGTWVLVAFINSQANRPLIIGSAPSAGRKWPHADDPMITGITTDKTDFYLDDGAETAVLKSKADIQVSAERLLDLKGKIGQLQAEEVLVTAPKILLQGDVEVIGSFKVIGGGATLAIADGEVTVESPVPVNMRIPRLEIDTTTPLSAAAGAVTAQNVAAKDAQTGEGDAWVLRPSPAILVKDAQGIHATVLAQPGGMSEQGAADALGGAAGMPPGSVKVEDDSNMPSGTTMAFVGGVASVAASALGAWAMGGDVGSAMLGSAVSQTTSLAMTKGMEKAVTYAQEQKGSELDATEVALARAKTVNKYLEDTNADLENVLATFQDPTSSVPTSELATQASQLTNVSSQIQGIGGPQMREIGVGLATGAVSSAVFKQDMTVETDKYQELQDSNSATKQDLGAANLISV